MKQNILILTVLLILGAVFFSQCSKSTTTTGVLSQDIYKVWQVVDASTLTEALEIKNAPKKYVVLKLKINKIKQRLKALEAKEEKKGDILFVKREKPFMMIELPSPQGTFGVYRIENSSLFSPELAKKFPDIRSYAGNEKGNEAVHVRLDVNPSGLFAMITSPSETVYIRPVENDYYICYNKSDVDADNKKFYEPSNK